uniref:Biogenesis of lysosome-related organelles complex 1 subunit 6 n=1 Tax=Plectus sambesii TaxID=2011161 RepID=A0A914W5V5_9BILA
MGPTGPVADDQPTTSGSSTESTETTDAAPHHLLANSVSKTLNRAEILLEELTASQQMLLANIEDQNKKLGNNEKIERFHKTMMQTSHYLKKLIVIKKDMLDLHARSSKLKARASRLRIIQEQNLEVRKRRLLDSQRKEEQLQAKAVGK